MACVHGNDPRTCIVCQTLAEVEGSTAGGRGTATQTRGSGTRTRGASGGATRTASPMDLTGRASRTPASGSSAGGHRFGFHVAVFIAVLAVAAISVWFVAGIIFTVIRLIEILVVAAVAGTLGYRIGVARGRREDR